jgi:hypothetical protein
VRIEGLGKLEKSNDCSSEIMCASVLLKYFVRVF